MTSEKPAIACLAVGGMAIVALVFRALMGRSNTQIHEVVVRPEKGPGKGHGVRV